METWDIGYIEQENNEKREQNKEIAKIISSENRIWQEINDMETKCEINIPKYKKQIDDAITQDLRRWGSKTKRSKYGRGQLKKGEINIIIAYTDVDTLRTTDAIDSSINNLKCNKIGIF